MRPIPLYLSKYLPEGTRASSGRRNCQDFSKYKRDKGRNFPVFKSIFTLCRKQPADGRFYRGTSSGEKEEGIFLILFSLVSKGIITKQAAEHFLSCSAACLSDTRNQPSIKSAVLFSSSIIEICCGQTASHCPQAIQVEGLPPFEVVQP